MIRSLKNMKNIELDKDEDELRQVVLSKLEQAMNADLAADTRTPLREAGAAAHKLHTALKKRGIEPKHHDYMIRNRGLQPDDPEFYMQVHAIQDLVSFLANPQANDDPVDQTLGAEFEFIVYSRRWGHDDTYQITRTEDGWNVRHIAIGGQCDTGGHPFLFQNFDQDYISYPSKLDSRLAWLWEKAKEDGLSYDNVQQGLQELADWVTATERSAPSKGVWEGY